MKTPCFIILFLLSFLVVSSKSIVLDGKTYTVDTLTHHMVGPGSQYTALRLNSNERLDVFFVKVDVTNPYISFKAVLGRDSIYGGERTSAMASRKSKTGAVYFAGTNADFFGTSGYIGYPLGGCMVENEIAKVPAIDRKIIAFEENKIPSIGIMTYNGNVKSGTSTWTLNGVNHLRDVNKLILYNQLNGTVTRTNDNGTEVLVQLSTGNTWGVNKPIFAKVIKIVQNKGNMAIPKGYAVLSGDGTAATNLNTLKVNDEVEIRMNLVIDGKNASYSQIVGGDNRNPMLYDGVVETTQVWDELHPRTAIGYSQDKNTVIFCVVDGRGVSAGVTTKQLAQLMKSAGAYSAFNLDGGGSSTLYVKEFGLMNSPSDGSERSVGNAIFAVSSAPATTTITEIQPLKRKISILQNGVVKPKFVGLNQYGTLIYKDLQGVVLSCSPEIGKITSDGSFQATGTVGGILTARYGGVETQLQIELIKTAEPLRSISEDFSSAEWAKEILRYNPTYIEPTTQSAFTGLNNVNLYFDKYALEGAIVGAPNTPICAVPGNIHHEGNIAVAFRFRNTGESYMEFPELASAGTITLHVRNGNSTDTTSLTLQKYVNNGWTKINTFILRKTNDFSSTSMDEILKYDVNSAVPIRLRLSRGAKFINLYRVDVQAYGETGVKTSLSTPLKVIGRKIYCDEPTKLSVYNVLGVSMFEKFIENEIELPVTIDKGIFLVKTNEGVQKIFINK